MFRKIMASTAMALAMTAGNMAMIDDAEARGGGRGGSSSGGSSGAVVVSQTAEVSLASIDRSSTTIATSTTNFASTTSTTNARLFGGSSGGYVPQNPATPSTHDKGFTEGLSHSDYIQGDMFTNLDTENLTANVFVPAEASSIVNLGDMPGINNNMSIIRQQDGILITDKNDTTLAHKNAAHNKKMYAMINHDQMLDKSIIVPEQQYKDKRADMALSASEYAEYDLSSLMNVNIHQ